MDERNNPPETISGIVDANKELIAEEFSSRDCIESMAARFRYDIISTSSDSSEFTIARPEVFHFTAEENRIFTNEIYNFLREYYIKKNCKIEKNSSKKRFEIWKDNQLRACIGLHHDQESSAIWWYGNLRD